MGVLECSLHCLDHSRHSICICWIHVFFIIKNIFFVPNVIACLNLLCMGSQSQWRKFNYPNPEWAKSRFPKSPPFLPRNLEMLQQLFIKCSPNPKLARLSGRISQPSLLAPERVFKKKKNAKAILILLLEALNNHQFCSRCLSWAAPTQAVSLAPWVEIASQHALGTPFRPQAPLATTQQTVERASGCKLLAASRIVAKIRGAELQVFSAFRRTSY